MFSSMGSAQTPAASAQIGQLPSPEELMKLMQELQEQDIQDGQLPGGLKELLNEVKKEQGLAQDTEAEEMTPEPGFVIKTNDEEGRKFFINVCYSDKVAAPGNWTHGRVPDEVLNALDNMDHETAGPSPEALRFPLSCGAPRLDSDKKGEPCMTTDIVLNSDVCKQAQAFRKLKAFIIELALSWVGHKAGVQLNTQYKLPKMRYKGEVIEPQRIRIDRSKRVVLEVKDAEEEPSFALRTSKAPAPTQAATATSSSASGGGSGSGISQLSAAGSAKAAVGKAGAGSSAAAGILGQQAGNPAVSASTFRGVQSGGPAQAQLAAQVEYEGRPVEAVLVRVALPEAAVQAVQAAAISVSSTSGSGGIRVDVHVGGSTSMPGGTRISIAVPQYPPMHVDVPFAVQTHGAVAEVVPADALKGPSSSTSSTGSTSKAGTTSCNPSSKFSFAASGGAGGLNGNSSSSGMEGSASGRSTPGSSLTKSKDTEDAASSGSRFELHVRLPYRSLADVVLEMQRCRPLAYGQLQLASEGLLELEP